MQENGDCREFKNEEDKLSLFRKAAYGLGEAGSQFSWTLISSYITVYYTDVVGLAPAVISMIMLLARVWDAVNDPMFGAIAETTHSRWGRYRPYILFGAPILALFNCLTFLNLNIPDFWKMIWCSVTYIGCGMAYTAVNISVGCLANTMTASNQERVSLNAFRGIVGNVVTILVNAVTIPLILFFGHGSASSGAGYFGTAVIFSVISIPCFLGCVYFTKEKIGNERVQHRGSTLRALFRSFQYIFRDRNALLLILAMFTFLMGIFGRLGVMAYYFIYVLENTKMMAVFATALSVGMFVVNFYAPFLLNHMDKKKVGALSALCQAVCCILFFFLGERKMLSGIIIVGFIYGATNFAALVSYTLGAEIIDANWLKTGVRSDGVIYSCISFSTKMGNALGGSVGILALGAVGFMANQSLPAETLTKMNGVINFGPAIFFLLSAVLFARNGMTNEEGKRNEEKIKEKYRL